MNHGDEMTSSVTSYPGWVAPATHRTSNPRWLGLAVMLAATFVAVLDNFIVFVAIKAEQSQRNGA
jgi:hypothetical protein